MDDLIPAATPSVYHSAHSSSVSSSPDDFRTPYSTWQREDTDTTPCATAPPTSLALQSLLNDQTPKHSTRASPLLERYINFHAVPGATTTPTAYDSDTMPISTRLRERKGASQSSVTMSSPTRTASTSTLQADHPSSPLIDQNLLHDLYPDSPSYRSHLSTAVDTIVHSLMSRGRIREGHGMRELYTQSFKDPGTAELLDALLRQRASERQMRDFGRYVEDVNRLNVRPPVVVIPTREKVDSGVEDASSTIVQDSTSTQTHMSPRVVIEVASSVASQDSQPSAVEPEREYSARVESEANEPDVRDQPQRKRKRRVQRGGRSQPSPPEMPDIPEETNLTPASPVESSALSTPNPIQQVPTTTTTTTTTTTKIETHPPTTTSPHANTTTNLKHLQLRRHRQRKKKRKARMFAGANGPVYSTDMLGVKVEGGKMEGLLWR